MNYLQQLQEAHKARQLRLGHVVAPRPFVRRQLVDAIRAKPVPPAPKQLKPPAKSGTVRFVVPPLAAGEYPKIQTCQQVVAQHYQITVEELLAHVRRSYLVEVRHVAMYLACILTNHSLSEIGRRFMRDHSTVINAKARIEAQLLEDEQLRQTIQHLTTRITGDVGG